MQQDLKCRKNHIHSSEGHKFHHHKSERSAVRRAWLVASFPKTLSASNIDDPPSSSFRRGILFSFGLHHSDVLSSPLNVTAALNYWVTVANFNSPSKMASRSEVMQTWAMSVEYRTSFGKGTSIRGCTLSCIMLP
ncbi:hypothetical protein CEXT_262461 [Caerostris extrusa]|uniref:Uncharacterized protein n=1 Tax=Caerostris extrusa TaxID=172846 RepID=A0AAV4SBY9_CAEEX|nr:hypothetical protein CEXT_262461 [Caerostris extrusa]